MAHTVHQLKVTLRGVKPSVWRRIVVRSVLPLGELALILEGAMGWLGGHLHAFDVDGISYGSPDPDWPSDDLDENQCRLGQVLTAVGDKMRWDYDFGDGWEHNVVVEKIFEAEPGVEYPICLAGKRACPPEDCGGPHGYAQLLEVLADPNHPEHEELKEWAPIDFDPDYFNVDVTSLEMRSPSPLEGW